MWREIGQKIYKFCFISVFIFNSFLKTYERDNNISNIIATQFYFHKKNKKNKTKRNETKRKKIEIYNRNNYQLSNIKSLLDKIIRKFETNKIKQKKMENVKT